MYVLVLHFCGPSQEEINVSHQKKQPLKIIKATCVYCKNDQNVTVKINIIISLINSSVSIFRFLSTSLYMYVFFYPKLNHTVYTGFQLYCFSSFISYICSYVDKYPPIRTFLKGFVVFHLWAYHNLLALSPFVKYINCFTFLVIINRAFNDFPCRSLFTFISDYFLMKQSQSWTY